MKTLKKLCVGTLIVGVLAIVPLLAQQTGLVNVDLSNIRTEIAKNINVDVSQIPVTVQVPISVAANVCDVNAAVLADQAKSGTASCTAKNDTSALNTVVQDQINKQKAGSTPKQ
jgi:hypothetical protein